MKRLALLLVPLLSIGCIHEPTMKFGAPVGDVRPTPQQVSSCRSTKNWHNAWTLMGALFSGLAGAGGAGSTITTNTDVQMVIGISTILSGVFAAVSTSAAGLTADSYSQQNCETILSEANATTGNHK